MTGKIQVFMETTERAWTCEMTCYLKTMKLRKGVFTLEFQSLLMPDIPELKCHPESKINVFDDDDLLWRSIDLAIAPLLCRGDTLSISVDLVDES